MRASGIRQVLQPLGRPMRGHEDRVEVEVFANRIRVWPGDPPEVTLHTWRSNLAMVLFVGVVGLKFFDVRFFQGG